MRILHEAYGKDVGCVGNDAGLDSELFRGSVLSVIISQELLRVELSERLLAEGWSRCFKISLSLSLSLCCDTSDCVARLRCTRQP